MIQITEAYKEAFARLNHEQRIAVEHIDGPLMVVAGPGTGKTEILTTRIGNILLKTDTNPDNILCLTYTDTAAVEMRKRLIKYIGPVAHRVHIQTFHAFCNGIILEHPDEFGIYGLELANDIDKVEILEEILSKIEWNHPVKRGVKDLYSLANMLKKLFEDMKKEDLKPERLIELTNEEIKANALSGDKLKRKERFIAAVELYQSYVDAMIEKRRYDFDDMIIWVIKALQEKDELLRNYQEKFQYILVDEFQDTSGSQFEILDLLCNYWENPNLFVVGDDDQSIFRFQGANIENIALFHERYKEHLQLVVLKQNYRSSQHILNLSKDLISSNIQRLGNRLEGATFDKTLISANKDVAEFKRLTKTVSCKNPQQEAIFVVKEIEKIIEKGNTPLTEIAVLYPKNALAEDIRVLLEKKQIPYQISQNVNVLESKVVDSLLLIATYISRERRSPFKNDHLLFDILNLPYFNIKPLVIAELQYKLRYDKKIRSKYSSLRQLIHEATQFSENNLFSSQKNVNYDNIYRLSQHIEEWIQLVDSEVIPRIFDSILGSGILTHVVHEDKHVELMEDLESFFAFLRNECEKSPYISIGKLIEKIELFKRLKLKVLRTNTIGSSEGVILSTVHSAKGKEFDHVFMIGCIKNHWERKWGGFGFSFPENLFRINDADDIEEKRRLFYVGLTRCKRYLTISLPEKRESVVENQSIFYTEVDMSESSSHISLELSEAEQLPYLISKHSFQRQPSVSILESSLIKNRIEDYSLSVSHLNKYLECPLTFYYENIIGIPMVESSAIVFGSVVHTALEIYFRKIKNDKFPAKELLIHLFNDEMERRKGAFHEKEFNQRLEGGRAILSKYYDDRRINWNPRVEIEKKFSDIIVDNCVINGKIDKIELSGKKAVLVDYKTGNYKNNVERYKTFNRPGDSVRKDTKHHVTEFGGNLWRQAVFYKILIQEDPKVDWQLERVEFDFIESDKNGVIPKPHGVIVSDKDIEVVKKQIKSTYSRIKNLEFSTGCGQDDCKWCNYAREKLQVSKEKVKQIK